MKDPSDTRVPSYIDGYGEVIPFRGAFNTNPELKRKAPKVKVVHPGRAKVLNDLESLFKSIPIRDGMTLSFHHHFRNGDRVVNKVLAKAAELGIKDLKIALSAVFPVHSPLIEHVKMGTVAGLDTNYISGPVAAAVSQGLFPYPVVMRTHGGRARAIECGTLPIDVAFIAASAADDYGNANGVGGKAPCGSLGYAFPDAEYADYVVVVTDVISPYPLTPISIPQTRVDYVVKVDCIGDPGGIVSGTTTPSWSKNQLKIAEMAASSIESTGLLKDGFSFQAGAGGSSLATAQFIRHLMKKRGVTGSFILGGITGSMVQMLNEGLFSVIFDVQGFDLEAVKSLASNPHHIEIGAGFYANPFNSGCAVNRLDCVVLGAAEIDTAFNVNVTTGSTGIILGGSGGHSDAAAGAKLTVIVAELGRGQFRTVVDRVNTITTPGETVDMLVTEEGVAVNPKREDLRRRISGSGIPLKDIHELKGMAEGMVPGAIKGRGEGPVVAVVEYRDGTVIDVVRKV
ncbi:MAG: citrate lyase subunit alpha [Syntrophorhabdaceae bacterium]|nr:citrate lyase subunit alpha [Syntrophorhabdaceae bacterium]